MNRVSILYLKEAEDKINESISRIIIIGEFRYDRPMNKSTHLQTFDLESRINPLSLSLSLKSNLGRSKRRVQMGALSLELDKLEAFFAD